MKKIITTIGPNGWDTYGRRFAESFMKFWPKKDLVLEVFYHDLEVAPEFPGITFRNLNETASFQKLKAALPGAANGPQLQYSFKAVALASAVTPDLDWIAFVDADTETFQPVDKPLLEELFDDNYHLTYLYRKSVAESEGSWFAFNLRSVQGASLLADFWGLYDSIEFRHYIKAHDNAILDRLVTLHRAHGLEVKNLAVGALGLDAFHQSMLGAYMVHYKGPNKDTIADPGMACPERYNTLCQIVQQITNQNDPKAINIIEVGTWNGSRAVQMAEAAFAAGAKTVTYQGYDTFEEGNDRAYEGHTKPHATEWIVNKRLQNYAKVVNRSGRAFNFRLTKGNTLTTLAGAAEKVSGHLVYLDGGHSYETVKSDYNNLKHIPYIVFDDVVDAADVDGPKRVWTEAPGQKMLINTNDGYGHPDQKISFGVVVHPGLPRPQLQQQIQVKPVDSVDKSEQFVFIKENAAQITNWLGQYQAHNMTALLVSAGPTLTEFLPEIRDRQKAGAKVFAVKHAYPILKKAGITPDFTVVLDPRPVDGMSTHGVKRTDLFAGVEKGDRFLLATMTHPSVHKLLLSKGGEVLGWHAHTQGTQNANLPEFQKGLVVGGGTCAATRMPMLAFIMGFRRMEFYGYDFYYAADTDPKTVKQDMLTVGIGSTNKQFWTTGELIAAMQDLGVWCKWMAENRLTITFHGDGAGATIWESTLTNYKNPPEWNLS